MQTLRPALQETPTPLEALDQGLRRLMWLEQKRFGQILAEHKLTVPQFLVLVNLIHAEHGCPMSDLADKLFQSNATMTGIVDRLVAEKLVVRTRGGESDRRRVLVQLTPKGRTQLERANLTRREQVRHALAKLPPEDVAIFARSLNAYLDELEKESE